jgi:hypothetical protein
VDVLPDHPRDADLGSYYSKKIDIRIYPTAFLLEKMFSLINVGVWYAEQ